MPIPRDVLSHIHRPFRWNLETPAIDHLLLSAVPSDSSFPLWSNFPGEKQGPGNREIKRNFINRFAAAAEHGAIHPRPSFHRVLGNVGVERGCVKRDGFNTRGCGDKVEKRMTRCRCLSRDARVRARRWHDKAAIQTFFMLSPGKQLHKSRGRIQPYGNNDPWTMTLGILLPCAPRLTLQIRLVPALIAHSDEGEASFPPSHRAQHSRKFIRIALLRASLPL